MSIRFQLSEKAGHIAFVTGSAFLPNFHKNCIGITVRAHFVDRLHIAGGFTLTPEFFARPAVKVCFPGPDSQLEGFTVHVGQHQHFARSGVLHNCRRQAVLVKLHFIENLHGFKPPGTLSHIRRVRADIPLLPLWNMSDNGKSMRPVRQPPGHQ
jgi:hypothetical protein